MLTPCTSSNGGGSSESLEELTQRLQQSGCSTWQTSSRSCTLVHSDDNTNDSDNSASQQQVRQRCMQRRTLWRQCQGQAPEQVHTSEEVTEEPILKGNGGSSVMHQWGGSMGSRVSQFEEMQAEDMLEGAQQAIGMFHSMMGLLNPPGKVTQLANQPLASIFGFTRACS